MNNQIIIDHRFCGPPDSGNGGYTCGMLAKYVGNPSEITLVSPPPLERPLAVSKVGEQWILSDGEVVVARGEAGPVEIEVPEPPTAAQAGSAVARSEIFEKHSFPTCFVCGPQRTERDGLRIFAGQVPGESFVCTQWIPDDTLTDNQGMVRDEIIWAALDCPGAWTAFSERTRTIVLGKLAVQIFSRMKAGDPCIVMGWKIGEEGRKLWVGTALFSNTGQLYAQAKATWIELKSK